ncbi:hypothetical protein [Halomicrococcus gelatinilyticus]|uniref:hypothetical protein n=1 Tax=Halomicrococcus gelatinilyticus TaxID=1702103 RepID=UPI002E103957
MVETHTHRLEKGVLAAGFVALAVGVAAAHASPATGYELSIYRATPPLFWGGIGVALVAGVGVAHSSTDWRRCLALLLGGGATLAVVALPLLRGYYFMGAGDALTHLGWAKDVAAGRMAASELLYPGTHTVGVVLSEATGLPLRDGLLLAVVAFALTYLLFVPLTVRAVTGDRRATTFAALAGFLLLPIDGISVFNLVHPTSQAILFVPVLVYLATKYVTNAEASRVPPFGSATGCLLALSSITLVLVHPQQAVNAALLFGGVAAVQFAYRRFSGGHAIARHRPLYGQTALLLVAVLAWASRHELSAGSPRALAGRLVTNTPTGSDVGLSQIGGSLQGLFLKVFLVSAVVGALAVAFVCAGLFGRVRDTDASTFTKYLAVGLVPLSVLFAVFLGSGSSQFHFRVLGFVMVPLTMLAGVAVARGLDLVEAGTGDGGAVTRSVSAAVLVLLALSVPTLYHSPYTHQASGQVTEARMTGYATAFDHRGDAQFGGLRSTAERYAAGVLGDERSRRTDVTGAVVDGSAANATGENFTAGGVAGFYDGPRYLPLTTATRQRELAVYDGSRFPARGFRTLASSPAVSRVQSCGGFRLYHLNGSER